MLSANENRREISRASRLPARTGDFSYRNTVNRSTDLSAEASAKEETPLPSPFSPPSSLRRGYDRQAGPATGSFNGLQPKSKFLAILTKSGWQSFSSAWARSDTTSTERHSR
jgi:hypothetical protein